MSDEKVTRQAAPSRGQNSAAGRPRSEWNTESFGRMVRSMRASGVPDEGIALLLFGEKLDERIEKRLDRAEKSLPRNPRDRRTRQAFGNAFRKVREAESEEAQQIALVGAAEAILGVLEAEPGEHRDWLPEHIRNDPARAIAIEIARAKSEFAAQGEQASRPRASQLEGVKDRRRRGQLEALGHS